MDKKSIFQLGCQPILKSFSDSLPVWGNPDLILYHILRIIKFRVDVHFKHGGCHADISAVSLKFVHFKYPVYAILISLKSVVIFAEIKTKSAKMTTLLKEMRIA